MPNSFFHHAGVQFHYQVIGRGRPFVFCHGLTGDIEHLKQLMKEPPAGWQMIVWDCRFHGLTNPDSASRELSFELFARDLAALLDHFKIASAVIGGVSMGAGIAVRFAADHPERTEALVLCRPAWIDGGSPSNLMLLEQIGDRMAQMDGAEVIRRFEADKSSVPAAQTAESIESLRMQCEKPQARERALRLRAMPRSAPIRGDEISRLTMRALVMGNYADGIHPFEIAQWWKDKLGRNATLVEVPSKSLNLSVHEATIRQEILRFLDGLAQPRSTPV